MKLMNGLTSTDICEVIKSCGENGVSKISFGDAVIEFGLSKDTVAALEIVADSNPVANGNEIEDTINNDTMDGVDLALSDPEAYEKYIMGEEDE